jgi:hypothetical protein
VFLNQRGAEFSFFTPSAPPRKLIGSQAISTTELINEAKISVRANQQV